MRCRRARPVLQKQIMADLPEEKILEAPPFTHVALDLFGPLYVKGVGCDARKTFKSWGVLYSCLSSKAVSIWLVPGYDTKSFLACHGKQLAIYGTPRLIVSDKGSQLVKAAAEEKAWEGWVQASRAEGTEWKIVPTQAPW